jgi:hypothetical protein
MCTELVRTNKDYEKFVTDTKAGHVADYHTPLSHIVESLSAVRGHIVEMPLRYMEKVALIQPGINFAVNDLTGTSYLIAVANLFRGALYLREQERFKFGVNFGRKDQVDISIIIELCRFRLSLYFFKVYMQLPFVADFPGDVSEQGPSADLM